VSNRTPPASERGCCPATGSSGSVSTVTASLTRSHAPEDVQIYLEQAGVGGQLHYLMQRPSYPPETREYWADLDSLGTVHKWTPRVIYINLLGLVYLFVGFFVLFKQGGRAPFVLHFATFCLVRFCLPLLHANRSV
jgi:hypothetical protein